MLYVSYFNKAGEIKQHSKLEDNEVVPLKLRRNGFQPKILYTAQLLINCENKIKMLLDILRTQNLSPINP